jgi:hypothetical protein
MNYPNKLEWNITKDWKYLPEPNTPANWAHL